MVGALALLEAHGSAIQWGVGEAVGPLELRESQWLDVYDEQILCENGEADCQAIFRGQVPSDWEIQWKCQLSEWP